MSAKNVAMSHMIPKNILYISKTAIHLVQRYLGVTIKDNSNLESQDQRYRFNSLHAG